MTLASIGDSLGFSSGQARDKRVTPAEGQDMNQSRAQKR